MFQTLYSYYHYGKAILFKTLPFTKKPDTYTVQQVSTALEILRDSPTERNKDLTQVLDKCGSDEMLLVTDMEGYNLLQLALVHDNQELIQYIVRRGCDLNVGDCSFPLHLASYLGQKDNVQLLLDNGAKPDKASGMCYPYPHHTDNWMGSKFFFISKKVQDCYGNQKLPIFYAIEKDNCEVASLLLESCPHPIEPLFLYACQHGASLCMELFSNRISPSAIINKSDEFGLTPLHHACKWGLKFLKYVIELGADISICTKDNKTLLHTLYSQTRHPFELEETTRYLLGSGLEQIVNQQDSDGNTALHIITQLVNKNIKIYGEHFDDEDYAKHQDLHQENVLGCIVLLLKYNCDPLMKNNSDKTAINLLLETIEHSSKSVLITNPEYWFDMDVFSNALVMYLEHAKSKDSIASYALLKVVHIISQMNLSTVPKYSFAFRRCVSALCHVGANPNRTIPGSSPVLYLLVSLAGRCVAVTCKKHDVAVFVDDMLSLLLSHGLDANSKSDNPRCKQEFSLNGLSQFVRLVQYARRPEDIQIIHRWLLTLLQHGADPDIEPYVSDPIICHSQSSIFLKHKHTQAVNQYMDQIQDCNFEGGYAESVLMLFYNSMDHDVLYQCLNNVKYITRFTSERMPSVKFNEILTRLTSNPRSLQDSARVAIYKALNRELNIKVDKLPLPGRMKSYLLNIE